VTPLGGSPYRTPSPRPPAARRSAGERGAEGDLLVPLLVLWLASVVRSVGAVVGRETLGAEATLAMLATVVLPWLARGAVAAWVRRSN
jgi:hypothetical protein